MYCTHNFFAVVAGVSLCVCGEVQSYIGLSSLTLFICPPPPFSLSHSLYTRILCVFKLAYFFIFCSCTLNLARVFFFILIQRERITCTLNEGYFRYIHPSKQITQFCIAFIESIFTYIYIYNTYIFI